ncbi:cytoplasmic protein [Amanita rubescens]|nr:cytoplasmic protein [Amanita rubescens]
MYSPTMTSPSHSRSPSVSPPQDKVLTLRALLSTKDVGIINVAELRDCTGVNSNVISGVHVLVLAVTGSVHAVAKAYTQLVSANPSSPITSIRLLISHSLMGAIIGRQGIKIKAIQDSSGARMIAAKAMLPESTERIVDVQGTPEAIGLAIEEIGKCLLENWERGLDTVLFNPCNAHDDLGGSSQKHGRDRRYKKYDKSKRQKSSSGSPSDPVVSRPASNLRTQNISIPSDMVGCIIGRGGTKITEFRRLSGSKISIAKTPHDETGERMFTIIGTPESNEKALFLLYHQLGTEKERRDRIDFPQVSGPAIVNLLTYLQNILRSDFFCPYNVPSD